MNRRFPLAAVLRVRTVQQDLAAADVARSRAAAAQADAVAHSLAAALQSHERPGSAGSVWSAASAVGLALAADAEQADLRARAAHQDVAASLARWADARADRRGVERLSERHTALVAAADARAEQRALDERRPSGVPRTGVRT